MSRDHSVPRTFPTLLFNINLLFPHKILYPNPRHVTPLALYPKALGIAFCITSFEYCYYFYMNLLILRGFRVKEN